MTDIPRAMTRIPLPSPPPHDGDTLRIVEAMLEKRPLDPDLQARLASPEAAAERAEREARARSDDWPALSRYRAANATVRNPDLVMIGDSLTEIWGVATPDMFDGTVINRGISGQTSAQILLRFHADVVALKPRRVHILCGTNDIAGNTGPNHPEDFQRNIRAMLDIAVANDIEVLLASLPPAATIFWSPDARPGEWIPLLNTWLRDFAARRQLRFLDYHAILDDGTGALRDEYSADGVHVTRIAYRRMRALLFPPA